MLKDNKIPFKQRFKELFIDYICILIYLAAMLGVSLGMFFLFLEETPKLNQWQTQLVSVITSLIPVTLIFTFLDYTKGSIGKQKAGLKLYYNNKTFSASLVRNLIKFLPWQLAHIGIIRGIYNSFDMVSILSTIISILLALLLLIMGLARRDKRHLGDLLAGTQIQAR